MADPTAPSSSMSVRADEHRAPHAAADASLAATSAPAAPADAGPPGSSPELLHACRLSQLDAAFAVCSPAESAEWLIVRALDAQLVDAAVGRLHTLVLPSVAAFEWSRRRDLPPMLTKPITRASPPVFMMQAHLAGMMRDAFESARTALRRAMARHLCARTLLHAAAAAKEVYLSLSVSRFHSRQMFVDLASITLIMRSFAQALRHDATGDSDSDGGSGGSASPYPLLSSSADFALQQLDLELAELACATVVTHPTLMSLDDVARLLRGWEQHWKGAQAPAAAENQRGEATSSASAAAPAIDMGVLAQQLGVLWLCEPFALPNRSAPLPSSDSATGDRSAYADAAPAPSSTPVAPPSFLDSFFALPKAHLSADVEAGGSAGISSPFHWIGQDLHLSECAPLTLLLDESLVLRHVSPTRLLRLISLRHELRADDYPELDAEEEQQAADIRTTVLRLQAAFALH